MIEEKYSAMKPEEAQNVFMHHHSDANAEDYPEKAAQIKIYK